MDTFAPPTTKKRRNAHGLQLSSRSLAPPPANHGASSTSASHPGMIQDALSEFINMNQATPTVSSARVVDDERAQTPTQASHQGVETTGGKSKISRKKPESAKHPSSPARAHKNSNQHSPPWKSRPNGTKLSSSTKPRSSSTLDAPRKPSTKSRKPGSSAGREKEALDSGPFGELKSDEFKVVQDLGAGAGGTVDKVIHGPTGTIMAKKLVLIDAKPAVRKQILRELQIMHGCSSPYIVSFYGAFMREPHICICMEYMDRTSLDGIYKKHGAIDIGIVGRIAEAVLEGLTYLYDVHRIIHRDIKPSNILVNSKGAIKICDFGVSGELINSIANTFVGTSTYMSPERIQGGNYSVKSDVWSLGVSLIELALGRFPFSDDEDGDSTSAGTDDDDLPEQFRSTANPPPRNGAGKSKPNAGPNMSILDLLQYIVNEPAPRLTPPGKYPRVAELFIDDCLRKDPGLRKNPKELLVSFYLDSGLGKVTPEDLKIWASSVA
ncbi:Dual specificity protein kinase fuz7 [Naganishia adeliensis]|uniref:Dual specificity protein kinase fuz7 n=1 Tax=Naganishia adeliensis TaxID=92952 RepID=A0ACC2W7D8_9TREE|nr:Dual specificity protein kinase fuz7 [Naganishia adeliensis]